MTATDQLRSALRDLEAKARELELDRKLETFADQADHYLRVAADRAGEYAAENRGKVEETFDKAGSKVDAKTDGKYTRYVEKLRTGVLVGVDWLADQRDGSSTPSRADAAPPAGSADSDAWVDVTDAPPSPQGETDPR